MVYIKGRNKITKQRYNKGFCEVEIEAYDHDLTQIFLKPDLTSPNATITNTKAFYQYDLEYLTANNKSSSYTITKTVTAEENGEYRILIFGLTSATYDQTIEVKINNKSLGKKSIKSLDEFNRCFDFGTVWLKEGNNTLEIIGGSYTSISIVSFKKIRRYYGNSDNEGVLKLQDVNFTNNGFTALDTFEMEILSHKDFNDPNASDYHKSGLVFELGDAINIKMGESRRKLTHSFGGYITLPELSKDELTISLKGVGRLADMDKVPIKKEITIGGATPTQSGLVYKTNNLYDAFRYLLESMELPLGANNLQDIINGLAPVKNALNVDMGLSAVNSKFVTSNISKQVISDPVKGTVVQFQNGSSANQTQSVVILDTSKKIVASSPPNIKNAGVFYIEYGMGNKAPQTKTITKTVTVKKKLKSGKIKTTTKKVKEKVVYGGFDLDKEFLAWIEIQYSDTPTSTIKTVNIDFTSNTTSNKLGAITPIIEENQWKMGEFDVVSVLNNTDPQTAYYIRKITLKTQTPPQQLYDPKNTEEVRQSYKMMFKRFGFRSGTAVIPEILKASGKSQLSMVEELLNKLKLNAIVKPATERRNDMLHIENDNSVVCDFEIIKSDNLIDTSNIKYAPADNLKNSVCKVYKNTSGTYNAVRKVDPYSIGHFGTYEDLEVLSDEVGEYNAKYQALIDLENSELCDWSYTATILGLPESARIGRLVPCVLDRSVLNGIKTIKSIKCIFKHESKKVYTELGLDDLSDEIKAQKNIVALRKSLLPQVEYTGGAEFESAIDIE